LHITNVVDGQYFKDDLEYNVEKIYSHLNDKAEGIAIELLVTREGAKILYGLDTGLRDEKLDFIENNKIRYTGTILDKEHVLRILSYIPNDLIEFVSPKAYKKVIKADFENILKKL